MKIDGMILLSLSMCLASCRSLQTVPPGQGTNVMSHSEEREILAWPDGRAPDGFMEGLQLISLAPELCREILTNARPSEAPQVKPDFKTPLAAAQYFGTHLNMGGPPKYMAVYADANGAKAYLFTGGLHWGKQPLFSETAVLLETGEISFYERAANPTSEGIRRPADGSPKPSM